MTRLQMMPVAKSKGSKKFCYIMMFRDKVLLYPFFMKYSFKLTVS